jgi:hypothetical integral membrane protein (TIGR02206 family)
VQEFHAFSATHAVVLGAFAFVTAIACALGLRWRGTARRERLERVVGVLMLLLWGITTAFWAMPSRFRIEDALPLHMCDVTGLITPLVLLTRRRWLRTLLYFWGLGLSSQAIITPILHEGPALVEFWLFWLTHASIIGTAVYDLIAGGYRPAWRDCLLAIGACAVWLVVVLAVDLSLGVNYGYVGNVTPLRTTVIDSLGPWPLRVYKMIVAVLALFIAMWLPWAVAGRAKVRSQK